jgi:predicted RNA binding protein YcfA (HicA-like mRNA interferase family)
MAPSLPNISGDQAVRAFQRLGWEVARQRGSHIIMVKAGERASLSVPKHNPVAKGTLRSLIRSAGLTMDEFIAATR